MNSSCLKAPERFQKVTLASLGFDPVQVVRSALATGLASKVTGAVSLTKPATRKRKSLMEKRWRLTNQTAMLREKEKRRRRKLLFLSQGLTVEGKPRQRKLYIRLPELKGLDRPEYHKRYLALKRAGKLPPPPEIVVPPDLSPVRVSHAREILAIQRLVASSLGLAVELLWGPMRPDKIAHARHLAMWLCRKFTKASTTEVGQRFGKRDHATVLYALRAVDHRCATDRVEAHQLNRLRESVGTVLKLKEVVA